MERPTTLGLTAGRPGKLGAMLEGLAARDKAIYGATPAVPPPFTEWAAAGRHTTGYQGIARDCLTRLREWVYPGGMPAVRGRGPMVNMSWEGLRAPGTVIPDPLSVHGLFWMGRHRDRDAKGREGAPRNERYQRGLERDPAVDSERSQIMGEAMTLVLESTDSIEREGQEAEPEGRMEGREGELSILDCPHDITYVIFTVHMAKYLDLRSVLALSETGRLGYVMAMGMETFWRRIFQEQLRMRRMDMDGGQRYRLMSTTGIFRRLALRENYLFDDEDIRQQIINVRSMEAMGPYMAFRHQVQELRIHAANEAMRYIAAQLFKEWGNRIDTLVPRLRAWAAHRAAQGDLDLTAAYASIFDIQNRLAGGIAQADYQVNTQMDRFGSVIERLYPAFDHVAHSYNYRNRGNKMQMYRRCGHLCSSRVSRTAYLYQRTHDVKINQDGEMVFVARAAPEGNATGGWVNPIDPDGVERWMRLCSVCHLLRYHDTLMARLAGLGMRDKWGGRTGVACYGAEDDRGEDEGERGIWGAIARRRQRGEGGAVRMGSMDTCLYSKDGVPPIMFMHTLARRVLAGDKRARGLFGRADVDTKRLERMAERADYGAHIAGMGGIVEWATRAPRSPIPVDAVYLRGKLYDDFPMGELWRATAVEGGVYMDSNSKVHGRVTDIEERLDGGVIDAEGKWDVSRASPGMFNPDSALEDREGSFFVGVIDTIHQAERHILYGYAADRQYAASRLEKWRRLVNTGSLGSGCNGNAAQFRTAEHLEETRDARDEDIAAAEFFARGRKWANDAAADDIEEMWRDVNIGKDAMCWNMGVTAMEQHKNHWKEYDAGVAPSMDVLYTYVDEAHKCVSAAGIHLKKYGEGGWRRGAAVDVMRVVDTYMGDMMSFLVLPADFMSEAAPADDRIVAMSDEESGMLEEALRFLSDRVGPQWTRGEPVRIDETRHGVWRTVGPLGRRLLRGATILDHVRRSKLHSVRGGYSIDDICDVGPGYEGLGCPDHGRGQGWDECDSNEPKYATKDKLRFDIGNDLGRERGEEREHMEKFMKLKPAKILDIARNLDSTIVMKKWLNTPAAKEAWRLVGVGLRKDAMDMQVRTGVPVPADVTYSRHMFDKKWKAPVTALIEYWMEK
jgi:hypothetical protein